MAVVHPFRGLRYSKAVGDLSGVVTQPYDRIGPAEEAAYLRRSPYSYVRLIGTKVPPQDPADYGRRAALLREWIEQGILTHDPAPGVYLYRQAFRHDGRELVRQGIIALLDLARSGAKPHEHTLRGPKEDRLKLFRATEAHLEHIFLLYRDPRRGASRAAEEAAGSRRPDAVARDDFGNRHELWYIPDRGAVEAVREALKPLELYIADGHHRFETSQAFMRECLGKGWRPASPQSFTALPVTLVNVEEPGCVIRPTPRVLRPGAPFALPSFLERVRERFEVEGLPSLPASREFLSRAAGKRPAFVLYANGKFWGLTLREGLRPEEVVPGGQPPAWKRLDVAVLHKGILEPYLGIDDEVLARGTRVDYAHTDEEAVALVDGGKGQAAFLLNPTRVEEVLEIADLGVSMPQKSTDFYPKLLSGLVAMTMEIEKP